MNVSVVGETMSESVATTLRYLLETLGLEQFQHKEATEEFWQF
jgi:sulfur carrier protein ThiS